MFVLMLSFCLSIFYLSSHRAGVNCERTLYEVKLQDASLLEGGTRHFYLFILGQLLLMLSPFSLIWENPQMVPLCSPALQS